MFCWGGAARRRRGRAAWVQTLAAGLFLLWGGAAHAQNTPPSLTVGTPTFDYIEDGAEVALTGLTVADADDPEILTLELTIAEPNAGLLAAGGAAPEATVAFTGSALTVNAWVGSIVFHPAPNRDLDTTIALTLSDGGEDAVKPDTGVITMQVTALNDAPKATGFGTSIPWDEDAADVPLAGLRVTDPDSGESLRAEIVLSDPAAGLLTTSNGATYDDGAGLWVFDGSVADLNAALEALSFVPVPDYDLNVNLSVAFLDGGEDGALPSVGAVPLPVTPNNDDVTLTPPTSSADYTEGDPTVPLPDLTVSDPDTGEQVRATITLSIPGAGAFTTTGGGAFDAESSTWSLAGTLAEVNAALADVAFEPMPEWDVPVTATVRCVDAFEDGAPGPPTEATSAIGLNVVAVNDQPEVIGLGQAADFAEDSPQVALPELFVSDPDSDEELHVTFTLTPIEGGTLTTPLGASYDPASGVWAIQASVAEVNAALGELAFVPTPNFAGDVTLAVSIGDGGEDGAVAVEGQLVLNGQQVNDPVTVVPESDVVEYVEDDPSVDVPAFVVEDIDPDEQVRVVITSSRPAAGALTTDGDSTWDAEAGAWTTEGTVAEVNSRLAALVWLPAANWDEEIILSIGASDGFEPDAMESSSDSAQLQLLVDARNDAPTAEGLADTTIEVAEDSAPVALPALSVGDVDSGETLIVTMSLSNADAGTLSVSAGAAFDGGLWSLTGPVQAAINALDDVTFEPAPDFDADFTITVSVADGGEDGAGGVSATWTIDMLPDNDPIEAGADSFELFEAGTATTLGDGATSVLANDVDPDGPAPMVDVGATTGPSHGSLTLNADGTFEYVHDGSEEPTDSFTYTVCDGAEPPTCSGATVDVSVKPVNDAPVAGDDALTVSEGASATLLDGDVSSLLDNDSDAESDPIVLDPVPVQVPAHGSVTLRSDGSFEYSHDGSDTTSDSFSYRIRDLGDPNGFDVGQVVVTITPVDDPGAAECGNGLVEDGEGCDDFNQANGDGCRADCSGPEPGHVCAAASPSVCRPLPRVAITEYLEDGTRDVIELHNPGSQALDLVGCGLEVWASYEAGPTGWIGFQAGSVVPGGGTFVVCNEQAGGFTNACDLIAPALQFDGRATVAVACFGHRVDVIGEWGRVPEQPFASGELSMNGQVLRRKCAATAPNPHSWPFDLAAEWKDGRGQNDDGDPIVVYSGLGVHDCVCGGGFQCTDDLRREECRETKDGSEWVFVENCAQNAGNPCAEDFCAPEACSVVDLPAGTMCNLTQLGACAGDACDGAGVCTAGPTNFVAGTACDDGDDGNDAACSVDRCDGGGTCANAAEPVGASCDDGDGSNDGSCVRDACTAGGACVSGPVAAGTPCGDGEGTQCTLPDACDGAGACVEAAVEDGTHCDDEVYCNGDDTCAAGACDGHAGDPCAAGPDCANSCDEDERGCLSPPGGACGSPADDHCTAPDACDGAGVCVSNDGPDGVSCDDGDRCNGVGSCAAGACVEDTAPVVCDPPAACEQAGVCQPASGACTYARLPDGTACDAAALGAERCFAGSCSAVGEGDVCDQPLGFEAGEVVAVALGELNSAFNGDDHCLGAAFDGPDVFLRAELPSGRYRAKLTPTGGGDLGIALLDSCDPLACTDGVNRGGAGLVELFEFEHTSAGPVDLVVDSRGTAPGVSFSLLVERLGATAEPAPEAGEDVGPGADASADVGGDDASSDSGPGETDTGTTSGGSDEGCGAGTPSGPTPAPLVLVLLLLAVAGGLRRRAGRGAGV